jgi:integrase
MGTVFKPIVTRPLPPGAQVVEREGKRVARWTSTRGGLRIADVRTTPRGDCIVQESGKYFARFKDGQGVTRTVATDCRDLMAARAVLGELERRAELVRAGIVTPAQDAVADHKRTTITTHVAAYLESLRAKGTTPKHVATVGRLLRGVIAGGGFKTLADIGREPVERWLVNSPVAQRSARTRNTYVNALKWFSNWCVDSERLVASPVARIPRADENADRRRQPRALTENELVRLLDAARRRPLEEALKFNRGWRKGQPGAHLRPETGTKLEALGRERTLIYKTLVLTGLRLAELASIRVCDVVLDGDQPHIVLDARHEKNRQGSMILLRQDLVADIRSWIGGRTGVERVFAISPNLVKVFDRDLRFAGIPKRDERGWTACVHSLRHTHGTLLSRAGVPPRVVQAALRHASPEFSLRVYVDPKLLDVGKALCMLPALPIDGPVLGSTGTDHHTPS